MHPFHYILVGERWPEPLFDKRFALIFDPIEGLGQCEWIVVDESSVNTMGRHLAGELSAGPARTYDQGALDWLESIL